MKTVIAKHTLPYSKTSSVRDNCMFTASYQKLWVFGTQVVKI